MGSSLRVPVCLKKVSVLGLSVPIYRQKVLVGLTHLQLVLVRLCARVLWPCVQVLMLSGMLM